MSLARMCLWWESEMKTDESGGTFDSDSSSDNSHNLPLDRTSLCLRPGLGSKGDSPNQHRSFGRVLRVGHLPTDRIETGRPLPDPPDPPSHLTSLRHRP